jgi:hypothetical protein
LSFLIFFVFFPFVHFVDVFISTYPLAISSLPFGFVPASQGGTEKKVKPEMLLEAKRDWAKVRAAVSKAKQRVCVDRLPGAVGRTRNGDVNSRAAEECRSVPPVLWQMHARPSDSTFFVRLIALITFSVAYLVERTLEPAGVRADRIRSAAMSRRMQRQRVRQQQQLLRLPFVCASREWQSGRRGTARSLPCRCQKAMGRRRRC